MANNFQEEKRKKRNDEIAAKREMRRNPEARKNAPRGIGSRRIKTPVPQPSEVNNSSQKNLQKVQQQTPPTQKSQPQQIIRRDRVEISEEAYKRFREELVL